MKNSKTMDETDFYEQAYHAGDPKIPVYDRDDVAWFCTRFPDAALRLRGMPCFNALGRTYLIRGDVWQELGGVLTNDVMIADPRCDAYRRSAMTPNGSFDPA